MTAMFIFITVYVAIVASLLYRGRRGFETQAQLPLNEGENHESR